MHIQQKHLFLSGAGSRSAYSNVALKQHWQVALKQDIIKPCCNLPIDLEINIFMYLVCVLFTVN